MPKSVLPAPAVLPQVPETTRFFSTLQRCSMPRYQMSAVQTLRAEYVFGVFCDIFFLTSSKKLKGFFARHGRHGLDLCIFFFFKKKTGTI